MKKQITIIFSFLILLSSNIISQIPPSGAKLLLNEGIDYMQKDNFALAWEKLEQAKIDLELSSQTNSELYAEVLHQMGVWYYEQSRNQESLELNQQVYQRRKKIHGKKDNRVVLSIYGIGTNYLELDSLDLAIKWFEEALEIGRNVEIINPNIVESIIDKLCVIYQRVGDIEKAINYRKEITQLRVEESTPPNETIAEWYLEIGNSYFELGDSISTLKYYYESFVWSIPLGETYETRKEGLISCAVELEKRWMIQFPSKYIEELKAVDDKLVIALGNIFMVQSADYLIKQDTIKALSSLEKGKFYLKHSNETCKLLHSYNMQGIILGTMGKVDSAINKFKYVEETYYEGNECNNDLIRAIYNLGLCYQQIGEFEKAKESYYKTVEILESGSLEIYKVASYVEAYIKVGRYHHSTADLDSARIYYNKSLDKIDALLGDRRVNRFVTTHLCQELGDALLTLGEFKMSFDCLQWALFIYKNENALSELPAARYFEIMGRYFQLVNNQPLSESNYKKALEIRINKLGEKDISVAQSYFNLALIQIKLDSAIFYHSKALDIRRNLLPRNHRDIASSLDQLGRGYYFKGEYDKAKRCFLEAYTIRKKVLPLRDLDIITSLVWLSKKECVDNYEEGIILMEEAKKMIGYKSPLNFGEIISMTSFADIAWQTGDLYYEWYLADTSDVSKLQNANFVYKEAVAAIDYELNHITKIETAQKLFKHYENPYGGVVSTSLLLYQKTDSIHYLNMVFEYAEKRRTWVVQKELQENLSFDILSKNMSKDYASLLSEIINLENQIFSNEISPIYRSRVLDKRNINRILASKKVERIKLFEKIKKDNPDFNQRLSDFSTASIVDVQDLMAEDQVMVVYTKTYSSPIVLIIKKKSVEVIKIEIDNSFLLNNIPLFFSHVTYTNEEFKPFFEKNNIKYHRYGTVAYQLYEQLFKPIEYSLKGYQRIILVADDITNGAVPFEALLTQLPKAKAPNLSKLSYLGNKYYFSYCTSASLWCSMTRKKPVDDLIAYAGFAPFVNGDTIVYQDATRGSTVRGNFAALDYSKTEVLKSQEQIGGIAYVGNLATIQKFKEEAAGYRILHLPTHGVASNNRKLSHLVFPKKYGHRGYQLLFELDIRNMDLNADLVYISACETDMAIPQPGMGIPSLAQAFIYAGTKSVVASKWKINDYSTSEITIEFFRHINAGKPKDIALGEAKRNYLSSQESSFRNHPKFWAGLILIGDASSIEF